MTTQELITKAYEDKVKADLQQAKEQLAEFEARAKGKMAQAEINTIHHLKARHDQIEKNSRNLKTIDDARIAQAKAELDEEVTKLKTSLAELTTKLRPA